MTQYNAPIAPKESVWNHSRLGVVSLAFFTFSVITIVLYFNIVNFDFISAAAPFFSIAGIIFAVGGLIYNHKKAFSIICLICCLIALCLTLSLIDFRLHPPVLDDDRS